MYFMKDNATHVYNILILIKYILSTDKTQITLEFPGSGFDINALSGWSVSKSPLGLSLINSDCGFYTIVGGYDNFGVGSFLQKTFSSLPDHQFVTILLDFYKIDYWKNDNFIIQADKVQRKYTYSCNSDPTYDRNFCGTDCNDHIENIYLVLPHTNSSLTLQFLTTLNANPWEKSWGINNLQITVYSCYSRCLTCFGPLNTQCDSCINGYFYENSSSSCEPNCSLGSFPANGMCLKCDSTCLTCSGPMDSDCTSCEDGRYQRKTKCHHCDQNCSQCTINSTYCIGCDAFLYLFNNVCYTSCISGYYSQSDYTCKQCDISCQECLDGSSSGCTSCIAPLILLDNQCIPCDAECSTCFSLPTNCTSCPTGLSLYNNGCRSSCPTGFWTFNQICYLCDSSCYECSAGTNNDCTSCSSGYFLDVNQCKACSINCKECQQNNIYCISCNVGTYLNDDNECVNECPQGYWANSLNNLCEICNSNCLNCSFGTYNSCISCNSGYYLKGGECQLCFSNCSECNGLDKFCTDCAISHYLYQGICGIYCPDGYWKNPLYRRCDLCDSSCLTCISPGTSINCLNCANGSYLINNMCFLCSNACATCEKTSTNCSKCASNYNFIDNQCLLECPKGYYALDNSCFLCNVLCIECTGPTEYECSSCGDGQTLVGTHCEVCDTKCLTCTGRGSSNCLSCNINMYLQENTCVLLCREGYYLQGKFCKKCDYSCYECINEGINQCISCNVSQYLKIIDYTARSGLCYQACPSSLRVDNKNMLCLDNCDKDNYLDKTSNVCNKCSYMCDMCYGPTYKNCLNCPANLFFLNNTCFYKCPDKYFANSTFHTCDSCPLNCKICNNSITCLNCSSDYYRKLDNSECDLCLDIGVFRNENDQTCRNCSIGCEICNSEANCTKCQNDFYLTNYQCKEKKHVLPIFSRDLSIITVYYLTFNASWPSLFQKLDNNDKSSYSFGLVNIQKTKYSVVLKKSEDYNDTWEIEANIPWNLSNISIIFKLYPPTDLYFNLVKDSMSLDNQNYIYCGESMYYNINNNSCTNLHIIVPFLTEIDQKSISLKFSNVFPDFFKVVFNYTRIEMSQLYKTYYNATLKSTDKELEYLILLEYNETNVTNPIINVNFDLPDNISYHPIYRLRPVSLTLAIINLTFTENLNDLIVFQQEFENFTEKFLLPLAFLNAILFKNSMSFLGLSTIKFIKYLRYLDINYPSNALSVFTFTQKTHLLPDLFTFNDTFYENLPNKLIFYQITPLILLNTRDDLFISLLLCSLVLFFKFIQNFLSKKKVPSHKRAIFIIRKIMNLSKNLVYLNLFLFFHLNDLIDFSFFSLINIYCNNLKSINGIVNFTISLTMMLFMSGLLFFIYSSLNEYFRIDESEQYEILVVGQTDTNMVNSKLKSKSTYKSLLNTTESPDIKLVKSNIYKSNVVKSNWWLNDLDVGFQSNLPGFVRKNVKFNPQLLLHHSYNNNEKKNKIKYKNWDHIKILTRDFNCESSAQKFFVIFSMFRFFISIIIIVFGSENPYFASVCLLILNIFIFFYLLFAQPYKLKLNFILLINLEICMIIAVSGALALSTNQKNNADSFDKGWMIFFANFIGLFITLFGYCGEFFILIYEIIKKIKVNKVHPLSKINSK